MVLMVVLLGGLWAGSAGASTVTAFPGDGVNDYRPTTGYEQFGRNSNGDGVIRLRVDMGSPVYADALRVINTHNATTNWAIKRVSCYVAADETDPTFNLTNPSHYALNITGTFPWNNAAGAERDMVLTSPVVKQYYAVYVWANGYGDISGSAWNGTTSSVTFSDIFVVPEPASIALLTLASGILLRRRK